MAERPLRHLFVMDPLDRIDVAGDSTYMQMKEATRRGWPVWWCTPGDLWVAEDQGWARCESVQTTSDAPHFSRGAAETRSLGQFDVVWMRKDPPFDMTYVFATYILDLVPPTTLVLNNPDSLRSANEKMFALQFPGLCPPTLVTRDIERARQFARDAPAKVVLKPWDGNGGRGVLVSAHGDPNLRSMLEMHTAEGQRYCIIQQHVPEISLGDRRIILIDGEPLGWFSRVPGADDHRGNMHVGARVEAFELSDREREICAVIAPRLKELGLLFVGIDVIGPYLTEINVTSPTGIQEVNRLMGLTLEVALTDAVERAFAARVENHP